MTGIIILYYNNSIDTINCINSICDNTDITKTKIIIVNNNSEKKYSDAMDSFLINKFNNKINSFNENSKSIQLNTINHLYLNKNYGYAKGNNKACQYFYDDNDINYLLILNNDILFTHNILPQLIEHSKKDNIGIVSPILKKSNNIDIDFTCARKDYSLKFIFYFTLFGGYNLFNIVEEETSKAHFLQYNSHLLNKKIIDIEIPSGSCMLCKKNVFSEIGSFDENTFLYWEENILFRKLKELNLKNILLTDCSCIHLGGATTRKNKTSSFLMSCYFDSLLYYSKTYLKLNNVVINLIKLGSKMFLMKIKLREMNILKF